MVIDSFIQDLASQMAEPFADLVAEKLAAKLRPQIVGTIEAAGFSDTDKYCNYGETCQMLGVSRPTLRKRVKQGLIRPVFDGTKTPRFRLSDIRSLQQRSAL